MSSAPPPARDDTPKDQPVLGGYRFLPRLAQVAIALGVLLPIASYLAEAADPSANHPCRGLPMGETGLWPLPLGSIVISWVGVVVGVTALVGGAQWLSVSLRHSGPETRWSHGGWGVFLVGAAVVTALNVLLLYSLYAGGLTRIADCG